MRKWMKIKSIGLNKNIQNSLLTFGFVRSKKQQFFVLLFNCWTLRLSPSQSKKFNSDIRFFDANENRMSYLAFQNIRFFSFVSINNAILTFDFRSFKKKQQFFVVSFNCCTLRLSPFSLQNLPLKLGYVIPMKIELSYSFYNIRFFSFVSIKKCNTYV